MRYIVFLCAASLAAAATWTVCKSGGGCNYTTINAALQDSVNVQCGDTVQVKAGQGDGTGSNGTPNGWYCGGSGNCAGNNPVHHTQACGNNPIIVTTDQAAKLPPSNVRITPAYADGVNPVAPTFYNPGNGLVFLAEPGNGGAPASGLKLVGVQFCCFSNFSEFISPGGQMGNGTLEPKLQVPGDVPVNITFDRVLIRTDPTQNTRKCLDYDAIGTYVWNSWIDCAFDENATDSQAIAALTGSGSILNNYVAGITETFNAGGAMPAVLAPIVGGVKADQSTITSTQLPGPIEIAWNEITKPRWIYAMGISWQASQLYPKGQIIHDAAGDSTPVMKAQNTCTSGSVQPAWPAEGVTVVDGTCAWRRTDTVDQAKNLLECKDCVGINLHHNFMHRSWPQGQQGYAITLTSSSAYSSQQRVNNTTIANNYVRDVGAGINTSGLDTAQDINAIPSIMSGAGPWNITASNNRLSITINGTTVAITLTAGSAQTAANVISDMNAAFGAAGVGLACSDNIGAVLIRGRGNGDTATCGSLVNRSEILDPSHYIEVNSTASDAWPTLTASLGPGTVAPAENQQYTGCINPRTLIWYGCGQLNGLLVQNNLWRNVNSGAFYSGVPYTFAIFQHEQNVQYSHNTVDALYGANGALGASLIMGWLTNLTAFSSGFPPFNVLIRDNVQAWRGPRFSPPGIVGFLQQQGAEYDFSVINGMFGQPSFADSIAATFTDGTAPAGIFSHNWLPGAPLYNGSPCTTRNTVPFVNNVGFNSYPCDNYNGNSVSFDTQSYRLLNPPGPATDFRDVGADPATIPRILNPNITVSDRAAVLSYQITEPVLNSGYGCIAYVTAKDSTYYTQPAAYDVADSTVPITDMDPSQFTQPDWDGNDRFPRSDSSRSIVIGLNQPLSPLTTYYLRLMCPGASWPEDGSAARFTTSAAAAGSNALAVRRTPRTGIGAISSMKVTYGTIYSRSTGTISGGGTVSTSCAAASLCQVRLTATRGAPLYLQVQYLDAGSTVLFSEPVAAPALP